MLSLAGIVVSKDNAFGWKYRGKNMLWSRKKAGGGCTDKLFWAFLLIFFRHGVCGKHGFFFVIIRNLITKY